MIADAGMATVAVVGTTITAVVATMIATADAVTTTDVATAGNHPPTKSGA
jgi:hypothetical protein